MTTLISFNLAKLLKEQEFDKYCNSGYTETGDKYLHQGGQELVCNGQSYYEGRSYIGGKFYCAAPTIAEVIMWLYEKHNIWIEISLTDNSRHLYFDYTITTSNNRDYNDEECFDSAKRIYDKDKHGSPTKAYEAAIEYCLTKLI